MGLLIRNGEIVTAADRYLADVRCEGGIITALGRGLEARAGDSVIDAAGRLVLPGFVDPHVHLDLPVAEGVASADDFASGTAAAIAGGTTTVIDFVTPAHGESLLAALEARLGAAKGAACDFALHMGITRWHAGTPEEMRELVEHRGVTSFKVYLAYKDTLMIDDGELYQVMEQAARLGAVVMVHAENGDAIAHLQRQLVAAGKTGPEYHPLSRPSSLEGEATHRALVMARLHGATAYIVHMTCRESVEALERAKLAGQRCFGETCPQYLLLDDRVYARPGFESAAYVLSPPIRPAHVGHHDALWRGLSNGLLDVVATDHCPFLMRDKERGRDDFSRIPNGGGGVEDRLALLHTYGVCEGRFDLQRMVALGSTHPARIFGLHPRKGTVAVGSDADLVVFDPAAAGTRSAKTHHSRADRNLYEGMRTKGAPTHVIVGGEVRFADGRLEARRGAGRFIARRIEGTRVPHPVGEKEMGRVV